MPSAVTLAVVGHLEFNGVSYSLADGRPLLADSTFRVAAAQVTALIGPNGTGKTTLLRIAGGELDPDDGAVGRSGSLAVMPQFIGSLRDDSTVRDLLLSVSPEPVRQAAAALDAAELEMMADESEPVALRYAQALADWADADGYAHETAFDFATVAALGVPYDRAKYRAVTSLRAASRSGWSWSCCWPDPPRCCFSTNRTTTWTCRPSSGWRSGWPRPARPCCWSPTTENCWPGPPVAS